MPQAVYILFGWLWTVATSIAFGAILFRQLQVRVNFAIAFVTGASILSLLVLALALAGAVSKAVFLGIGLASLGVAMWLKAHAWIDGIAPQSRWFWIGFAPFAVLYFFNAMAPEMSPDGMAYHLGEVSRYWRERRMTPMPWSMYASLSQGVEMPFLYAYAFGRHSAAALVHFAYLIALPLMIVDYAARRGIRLAGSVAALLVFASPVVGIDGSSAYVDVAVAAVWFALFVLLEDFAPSKAMPVGVLAGFAYGAKCTAGIAAIYALFRLRGRWREMAVVTGVAAIFILPWMIRNWVWLDNPVAPFANALFPNPHMTAAFEKEYSAWLRHYEIGNLPEWAWDITVTGAKSGGFLGPVWLLAPLGIAEWAWLFAAAAYLLNISPRFLIPALPFLALGMAKVLTRWRWVAIGVVVAHLALSWPSVTKLYRSPYSWFLERVPVKQALRIEPEESYLNFKRPEYALARLIENYVPVGERVFTWPGVAQSYTGRDLISYYQSTFGFRVRDVLATPVIDYFQPNRRVEIGLPRAQRSIRVWQTASDAGNVWTVAEIAPRPSAMRASHFPFSMELAFDGNPLTRWTSGTTLRPGMWVDLDFAEPTDRISVTLTDDQAAAQFRVEGATLREDRLPPQDWRRLATETVRNLGIRYFLIDSGDAGYQDFATRMDEWNIDLVAERGTVKLYRIR